MERKYNLKLGVVGTRRDIFSKEDALKYNGMILERLNELEVDFVDITHINEEGLLFDEQDVDAIVDFLKHEKVDALFFPHCNFGTEDLVAKVAKAVGKPVLLWGPKDEAPLANGARLRDSQCGLFATGKILRRFRVPFSYMNMCRLDDPYFAWRLDNFLRAAQVVKELDGMTILQIGTRPAGFWTVMVNEGAETGFLLESPSRSVLRSVIVVESALAAQEIPADARSTMPSVLRYSCLPP